MIIMWAICHETKFRIENMFYESLMDHKMGRDIMNKTLHEKWANME